MEDVSVGQIVWARVVGFPWWPATVARNSTKKLWRRQDGKIWVDFFNDPQGAWVKEAQVLPFCNNNTEKCLVKETHRSYRTICDAVKEAEEVIERHGLQTLVPATNNRPDQAVAAETPTRKRKPPENAAGTTPKRGRSTRAPAVADDDEDIVPATGAEGDSSARSQAGRGASRRVTSTPKRAAAAAAAASAPEGASGEDDGDENASGVVRPEGDSAGVSGGNVDATESGARKSDQVALEAQVTKLREELKRLKEELKAKSNAPRREVMQVAAVPTPIAPLSVQIPPEGEQGKEDVHKDQLMELLKTLKHNTSAFEELAEQVVDHRRAAGELASRFNARVRALCNAESTARKMEVEIADSLVTLLRWNIPFELLKLSQAGKPIRKVELKCGKRSEAVTNLAKMLIMQWMSIVKSGGDSKPTANRDAKKDGGSQEQSAAHTSKADEDPSLHKVPEEPGKTEATPMEEVVSGGVVDGAEQKKFAEAGLDVPTKTEPTDDASTRSMPKESQPKISTQPSTSMEPTGEENVQEASMEKSEADAELQSNGEEDSNARLLGTSAGEVKS